MSEDWSLRKAALAPNYGSTNPLLGSDFPENPDAPGPYLPPAGGFAATAPPSHLMDNVTGYEGISTGGDDGKFLPPPAYPGPGPGSADPPPNVEWSIPSISEDTAKQAFLQYAESKCCYSSAPAKNMVFRDFQPFNTFRYRLETFTECRSSEWTSVPYNGEVVDAYGTAPVPLPWDVPVAVPVLFKDSEKKVKVPHTSSVKPCQICLAMGRIICHKCTGSGRIQCWVCNGSSRSGLDSRCSSCNGMGTQSCSSCHGQGRQTCSGCKGKKRLLCFIELKITWKNNVHQFVADKNSGFPADLFKKVTGKQLFKDEQFMVYPLMTFPDASINQASQSALQQHNTQFSSTSRILRQRHTIELIPVTKVEYTWEGHPYSYFVYGVENLVFTENYPAKCCCSVM